MSAQTVNEDKKPSVWLRLLLVILLLLMIGSALGYKKYQQIQQQIAFGSMPPPPTSVTIANAEEAQWQNRLKAIGSLVASQGVEMTSEVSGIVKALNFESGQSIQKDELLLSLNNELEIAALATAEAQYASANSQYQRSRKLKNKQFVTENDLDQQRGAATSAKSQVESARAALYKKDIHAPFSGKLGIRNVDVGDYVSPGTKLVSLQSIDQLYLDFTLPERNFILLKVGLPVEFEVRSYPGTVFRGIVEAWDPGLDVNTRNVNVRAIVDNVDHRLAPGMFAELNVQSSETSMVITIPETAIFYNIYGEAVYVLDTSADEVVNDGGAQADGPETFILAARQIKVLYRKNGLAGINQGLKHDDKVVTSGQLKLFPSLKVVVIDDVPEQGEQPEDENTIQALSN